MQPRSLAIILFLLPLLASNAAYLISAWQGTVPWCFPYLEGCTSISRAARSSDAIFLFRATMITYALLLVWFWLYVKLWLGRIGTASAWNRNLITWLGIAGACSLIVYVVYLGSQGEVYRFMRQHGVLWFFTLTPLAQLLLHRQHVSARNRINVAVMHAPALRLQIVMLVMLLMVGLASIGIALAGIKTDTNENIVEWLFSLLLNLYFVGMIAVWKDFRIEAVVRPG